ncbi:CRISPR-associated endonuclease Cas1 [Paenibacillus polymyxa]|nr:CRISPR-associated endonuclease Cas1 [Paenibacillus polymyxa]RPE06852.1 hypothetical protein EG487_07980 [Paenibacillus polymyxa]
MEPALEEFRGLYVDHYVLTLINKKLIHSKGFYKKENEAVMNYINVFRV